MNTELAAEKSQEKKDKKWYPFSLFIASLLFLWPVIWIVLTLLKAYNLSFLPFYFETTDLLSLLLYSTFLSLLCKPLPLKAFLSLTNASFFVILLVLILPFVQASPLQLFFKILYPLYHVAIF